MSPKKAGLGVLVTVAVLALLSAGLSFVLRYQPKRLMKPTRKLFGRVSTRLWFSDRFALETSLVHHVGRKSGREYATPPCMVSTPKGFIVPAAFGPDVDRLANLRVNPNFGVVFRGVTTPTVAEVIDLERAVEYAGGIPGCSCWTRFRVEELVLLRPVTRRAEKADQAAATPTGEQAAVAGT